MLFDLMLMLTPLTGDRLDADRKARSQSQRRVVCDLYR